MPKPTVFISYSHKDEEWKNRLVTQLHVYQMQEILFVWEDRLIGGGEDWEKEIEKGLADSCAGVLMVSANSLTSDYILHKEVKEMLERREKGDFVYFQSLLSQLLVEQRQLVRI